MEALFERRCSNCKNLLLSESGIVCSRTGYRPVFSKDEVFAEKCSLYRNRYFMEEPFAGTLRLGTMEKEEKCRPVIMSEFVKAAVQLGILRRFDNAVYRLCMHTGAGGKGYVHLDSRMPAVWISQDMDMIRLSELFPDTAFSVTRMTDMAENIQKTCYKKGKKKKHIAENITPDQAYAITKTLWG